MNSSPARFPGPLDWLIGRSDPAHVALTPSLTYGDLREAVAALAADLRAKLGTRGAVLVRSEPTVDGVIGLLAVLEAELTAVLLPVRCEEDIVEHVVRQARPCGRLTGTDLVAEARPGPEGRLPTDGAAVVIYTSGTTALPKGVMLSRCNLLANLAGVSASLGLRPDDVVSLVLPTCYSYGLSMLLVSLRANARIVIHEDFAFPAQCVATMCEQATTVFAGVPFHYVRLLRESSGLQRAGLSLRLLLAAGGAMPSRTLADLRRVLPGATPLLMYGQTEATARLSCLPPGELDERPGSIGRGIPGTELTVRDADGLPVAPGQVGEVYARGESVMLGYLDDPAATSAVLTRWGLRTRDLATVDDDGFIYLRGRTAEYAKINGLRVSLPEIESVAESLDQVAEALASVEIGPSGETIVVELALAAPLTGAEWEVLRRQLVERLGTARRPSRIERVNAIRRTPTGKKFRRPIAT